MAPVHQEAVPVAVLPCSGTAHDEIDQYAELMSVFSSKYRPLTLPQVLENLQSGSVASIMLNVASKLFVPHELFCLTVSDSNFTVCAKLTIEPRCTELSAKNVDTITKMLLVLPNDLCH